MKAERSVPKPALLTPSASPPSTRSFFPQPYRISDKASLAKRPRLASHSHLPSYTSLDEIDVHQAREASTLRLFDVWSTLADRYSRPLDADDIIDITTGEVVKDRGVLRSSRNWNIGCFADNVEEDEEEDEGEDDLDELDSFANPGDDNDSDGILLGVDGRKVPPVTEVDPADVEDLKQFLEAERKRREICGSEEETEGSGEDSLGEEGLIDEHSHHSASSEDNDASPRRRSATSQREKDSVKVETDRIPRRGPSVYVDSGSDDELINWDVDAASMIYRLPKREDQDNRDSDIEFIETPALRLPLPTTPRTKAKLPPFSARTPVPDPHVKVQSTSKQRELVSAMKSSGRSSIISDAKGKGRKIDMEDPQEGASEADDESDDPITILSSPPVSMSKGKGRSHPIEREDPQSSSDSGLLLAPDKEQMAVIPHAKYNGVAAPAASNGTRKRKRIASSSEFEAADLDAVQKLPLAISTSQSRTATRGENLPISRTRTNSVGSESSVSTFPGEPETRSKPTRKSTPITQSRSRSRSGSPNHDRDSNSTSSHEDLSEPHSHLHRASSHFDPLPHSDPPYYPYHQPPYTPHHPRHLHPHLPHLYPPIADPRAQYIISQAMHQLSALVGGPWTPPTHGSIPYTPSHRHPGGPGSMYSTPTHHPHPYPYTYDPNQSRATLPPNSPDVFSSPATPCGSGVRRKSLVKRSRSGGRRVSFRVEEECVDNMEIHSIPVGVRERDDAPRERDQSRILPSSDVVVQKGVEGKGRVRRRGKAKASTAGPGPEPEPEPEMMRRGRPSTRAQTPGPPIHTQSSNTRSSNDVQSTSTTRRGRSRSSGAAGRRT